MQLQKNIYYLHQKYLLPSDLQLLLVISDVWRDGGAESAGQLLVRDRRILILHNYLVLVLELTTVTVCVAILKYTTRRVISITISDYTLCKKVHSNNLKLSVVML